MGLMPLPPAMQVSGVFPTHKVNKDHNRSAFNLFIDARGYLQMFGEP